MCPFRINFRTHSGNRYDILSRMDIILLFQSTLRKSWRQKLSGVHMYAQERGWFLQVINKYSSSDEIRRAIDEWHPIGCLVDRAMNRGAPPDILFRGIPTVYLDQDIDKRSKSHPCLLHDSAAEAALAGGELLRLKCASYAYIGTGEELHWDHDRLVQFNKDVKDAGFKLNILPHSGLKEAIVKLPKPCGILGANDDCAIKAFHAATAAGFSIPDDIAIAGIDNDEMYCESVFPGLTSAEPDFEGAGYRLGQMLADEIELYASGKGKRRGTPPMEKYGPLRLVRRGSTMQATNTSPRVRRALEYIRRHGCDSSICLDDVIREMQCSRRLGTLQFKKETGQTILESIHDCRYERACDLLTRTKLPIATVVANCGYKSDSFVKKMFLTKTGRTMRDYRVAEGKASPSLAAMSK